MKRYLITIQLVLINLFLSAQVEKNKIDSTTAQITITGVIADSTTSLGINGATIELSWVALTKDANTTNDIVKKMSLTTANGKFIIGNIPVCEKYTLVVSSIGYDTKFKEIFVPQSARRDGAQEIRNIGTIKLLQSQKMLGNVIVTSTAAPSMRFDIDRKIFDVEKNITAQGGTAVDVMKNIPSLSVDVDGNVQMRNSSPQILIDGRPTILTLDQIPADDIERVELVTNPSAKYDASSAGGIIDIIMKKNKRTGINGIASVGAGTPGLLNGNINLNLREEKFNFFVSGNYNRSGGQAIEETGRQNKSDGQITDYFYQSSTNERIRKFETIRFGMDYYIDNNSTLSLTQSFNNGNVLNNEIQDQDYLDKNESLNYTGLRTANGVNAFNRNSSRLSFEKKFDRPDKKLTADITYNNGGRNNESFITNDFYAIDGTDYAPANMVRNAGSGNDHQFTVQADYSNKMSDDKRIEFGIRSFYNKTSTNFGTYSIDQSDHETKLPLSNNYEYTEMVNAGYLNYANKWKSITYQLGLRVEFSKLDGFLVDSNFNFGYAFPDGFNNLGYALFPSFFLTKPLSENEDIQFNFSKRIRRPRFWEINPFVDINDPLNIRQGNPALRPEYTNSFELNYFNRFNKNAGTFLAVLYFKNNVGDVTQYSDTISTAFYQQLSNAAISPDAILNTYINAGYTNRMGAEFTVQKKLGKGLNLIYNADMQYRVTKASVNKLDLNNKGFNFGTKLIANYKFITQANKFFNNLGFQFVANYQGPRVIPQGRTKQQFVADFAMRKEFLKKKAASLSFSINDILNTRRFGNIYETENFYQDSYRRWSVRTFRITFTYKFGSANFDLFKRRNNTADFETDGIDSAD
ncbi:outer membrane beta-barrel protein [Panacibacter ginsenosidivorans]|nr:outer membrane beta-barrel protein [Panacibacter ginsenosidivorans]